MNEATEFVVVPAHVLQSWEAALRVPKSDNILHAYGRAWRHRSRIHNL